MAAICFADRAAGVDTPALGSFVFVHSLIRHPVWKQQALDVLRTPFVRPQFVVEASAASRIKARSIRAGTQLLNVRRAIANAQFDLARDLATTIEPALYWQRAQLAIARALFEHGRITEVLRIVRRIRD